MYPVQFDIQYQERYDRMQVVIRILILIVLFNLVNLLALPSQLQQIVRGTVIVLGVAVYSRRATAGS